MDENAGQKNSPGYRLAALDPDFLLGDSMRGVRLHLEYEKAEGRLRAWVVRSTIVVFGSARVLPRGSADETESTAPLPPRAVPRPGDQSARWYEEARRFGRIASERGGALRPRDGVRDNVIATGGGPGRLVILWWCQTIQAFTSHVLQPTLNTLMIRSDGLCSGSMERSRLREIKRPLHSICE